MAMEKTKSGPQNLKWVAKAIVVRKASALHWACGFKSRSWHHLFQRNYMETPDASVSAMTKELVQDALETWSDDKRKSFCKMLEDRIRASAYLNVKTAEIIADKAYNRKYLGQGTNVFKPAGAPTSWECRDKERVTVNYERTTEQAGGRNLSELDHLAEERAMEVLKELPPLKKAVQIIAPDVAKMIEDRDEVLEKGLKLKKQLDELPTTLAMKDLDQQMTIGEFRKMVKDLDSKRRKLVEDLNDLGREGAELEDTINKRLYSGLPGLSEAVIKVIHDHYERGVALFQLNRRVSEKVMFGDSAAATDILQKFEKDEVQVDSSIKSEFSGAMEKLKLAAKTGKGVPKALKK